MGVPSGPKLAGTSDVRIPLTFPALSYCQTSTDANEKVEVFYGAGLPQLGSQMPIVNWAAIEGTYVGLVPTYSPSIQWSARRPLHTAY